MEQEFLNYIKQAEKILVTSHISPDPDAVCSLLLAGLMLRHNFPDKGVSMMLEEKPDSLEFLPGYDQIEFGPIDEHAKKFNPDLLILVDVANLSRISRKGEQQLRHYIDSSAIKVVVIDHHQPDGRDEVDLYINNFKPSAVQEVYKIFFDQLELKKPKNYAQITMTGLYADTGGFLYIDKSTTETLELAGRLINEGVSVETIKYQLSQLSEEQVGVIAEMALNISHYGGFTYSYIGDEFINKWLESGNTYSSLQRANKAFMDNYIRSVDGRSKGFIYYRNSLEGDGVYSVSFRSLRGSEDVSKLARLANGGGHKEAAGGKIKAKSTDEALGKIKDIISSAI